MPFLVLVRHSISQPQPQSSPHGWHLTEKGRQQCAPLAQRLQHVCISRILTSDEPKAVETAQLLAEHLDGLPITTNEQFRETRRETALYYPDPRGLYVNFKQAIQNAMQHPDQLLFGEETFAAALARFSDAVTHSITTETAAIVSHGTILSLYIASLTGLDAYALWSLFDMPAFAVFSLPDMKLHEICFSLT